MPKEFWDCFQLFLGQSKLPSYLVEILKVTGYDSPISIELLNEERIKEIEQHIERNFGCESGLLKNTVYENKEVFTLLPGHITLLLGLKTYANKFVEAIFTNQKKKKSTKQKSRPYSEGDLSDIPEEIEVLSAEQLDKLKDTLVAKILKFCRKQNIDTENLSNESVKDNLEIIINTVGSAVYKCVFQCHLCEVRTPCIHNRYWLVGNLERHLKIHKTRRPNQETVSQLDQLLQKHP